MSFCPTRPAVLLLCAAEPVRAKIIDSCINGAVSKINKSGNRECLGKKKG